MALASTSSIQLRLIAEVTPGTTPGAGQNYDIRITGESFDFAIQKEASKEINASRMTTSEAPVGSSSSGGYQSELSYNEHDAVLAALMQSTWTAYGTAGVAGAGSTVAATATTLTASVATAGADSWATLKKGQWFILEHPSTANDGKLFRVSTVTAPTTTVITLDPNTPAAVVAATAGGKVKTSRLTHGTTQTSFSIERQALDVGQYFIYKGMTPSKLSLNASSGALTTMSIDFMGLGAARSNATFLGGSSNNPSTAYGIHSAVSNSQSLIWEGGAPAVGTFVKSIALEFDNALRNQSAIGSLAPVGIGNGTIAAKATLSVYFANGNLFDKFLANTATSLIWASLDSSGNGYVFTAPNVNVNSFKITAGSKDQDLMADVTLTLLGDSGNADAALRKVLLIDRVGAAVTR
mgnify:FL=1